MRNLNIFSIYCFKTYGINDILCISLKLLCIFPFLIAVYIADGNSIHIDCTRRMNDEMFKLLKKKQGNYDNLIPLSDAGHAEVSTV